MKEEERSKTGKRGERRRKYSLFYFTIVIYLRVSLCGSWIITFFFIFRFDLSFSS